MTELVIFYVVAAIIAVSAILSVTSKRVLRSAAFLLLVLIATAGLYLLLNYHFLAAVQLAVYAGGIVVLFIFAILLTSHKGDRTEPTDKRKIVMGIFAALTGFVVTVLVTAKHRLLFPAPPLAAGEHEINMKEIGYALLNTEKYGYLLPFEIVSVLLLASIVGGILIARKR